MKELSIEQKAKAYDEAIKVIKDNLDALNEITETSAEVVNIQSIKNCFYRAFPELKESENERIRKTLIDYFNTCHGDYYGELKRKDILAWLEKQGEQKKSYDTCDSSMMDNKKSPYGEKRDFGYFEEKPTDKVGPKFKVGDWITDGNEVGQVIEWNHPNCIGYKTNKGTEKSFNKENIFKWHKWTIQDAKDGDVLVNGSNIFIFHFFSDTRLMGYCHVNTDNGRFYDDLGRNEYFCLIDAVVYPATKEQRDALMKAMADARYTFDFEKKELKKIEQKPTEWSEEDESYLNTTIAYLKDAKEFKKSAENCINWLKSLKQRIGG